MDLIAAVICGLAGWRIASLFIQEEGPFNIFGKFRKLIGIKPGPIEGFLPILFSCIYCLSIWIALGAYLIYRIFPEAIIVMAISTIIILVDKASSRE